MANDPQTYPLSYEGQDVQQILDKADGIGPASQSEPGLMSAADKEKLDGIDDGAEENAISQIAVGGTTLTPSDKKVTIPVDSAPASGSGNPVSSGAVYDGLANKQNTIADLDTIRSGAAAGATAVQPAAIADFITRSVDDLVNYYLKSETYTKSEVQALIAAINQFHYEVYASLEAVTSPANNVLYLIGPTGSGSDKYEEYVWPNATAGFVKIGDTSIDLSGYVTTTALNTALANYTTTTALNALLAAKADKPSSANEGNLAKFNGSKNPVDSGIPADNVALKDGYYQTLIAGLSENLIGRGSVVQMFNRRPTAGTLDVGGPVAEIKALRGNSIVWNQMTPISQTSTSGSSNGVTFTDNRDGSYTVNGTATDDINYLLTNDSLKYYAGHKYLLKGCPSGGGPDKYRMWFNTGFLADYGQGVIQKIELSGSAYIAVRIAAGQSFTNAKFVPICFDLTAMFDEGKEPATVAEFEALYPLDYYAENPGAIKNVTATGLLTDGFNQWDEEWEYGSINTSNGQNINSAVQLRSKNYISVFPSTQYYIKLHKQGIGSFLYFYDANKGYITYTMISSSVLGLTFTTPANCRFIRFVALQDDGAYNHDICINLSHSGYRNGEYEPYWQSLLYTRITTMTGKKLVDGVPTGESRLIYGTDGMKGVNTDFDEAQTKKAIVRMGGVDLGMLDWTYTDNLIMPLTAPIPSDCKNYASASDVNIVCSKYQTYNTGTILDKSITIQSGMVRVKDSAYSDAATFKAAMNGVYLVYPLATPEEYAYDDNEMTPGGELPLNYREDDFGTESKVPADTANDVSAPLVIDVAYPMNAVDILRNLPKRYISVDSQVELLEAMKSAGKIAGYTMTWDATTGKYKYTIS